MRETTQQTPQSKTSTRTWKSPRSIILALVPLLLLAGVMAIILATDGGVGDRNAPPIETLSVQQIRLPEPGMMEIDIVNDGPDDISIAQVAVDDAYWQFAIDPQRPLQRLETATISIPYPWVQDEAHAVSILSSTGVVFEAEVAVAIESPSRTWDDILRFGLVGLYVGIVPVALGLLWYPFMLRLGRQGMNFILALTIGLLLFLIVDMWDEAHVVALAAPASLNATVLIPVLAVLAGALLVVAGHALQGRADARASDEGTRARGLTLAYQIAIGIGLHNLGEGLAIGSAFAIGEAALGVFLIAGFTLHNVTEGIGIAAPLVEQRPSLLHFFTLAAIAGGPAIIGTWIGAFTFSPFWTTVFLAIGIGAIAQVVWAVGKMILSSQRRHGEPGLTWVTLSGLAAGFAVMYVTALLVTA
ncbi:MAG: ZIP family metal transporter [Thermomicrobiales bacterium]